jgi:hypothetical protein
MMVVAALACAMLSTGSAWAQDQATRGEGAAQAASAAAEQPSLQQQIDELKQRLADYDQLKKRLEELETKAAAADQKQQPAVQAANRDTNIRIDGRLFAGVFKTDEQGSFGNRSLDIPDAKLRFTFSPSKNVTIVNRFSNNRAGSNGFDYFYLDLNNWGGLALGHVLRVGKFKMDVGQETWTDNPVESILITNSVSHISGYDEGVNFRGPLGRGRSPATYSLAVMNGSKGVTQSDSGMAWSAKLGALVKERLYLSASYLRTGDLVKRDGTLDQPDFGIAEVFDAPAGATAWRRSLWEADARYGYGKEGIKSVVGAPADVPWQAGATYGQFTDSATGAPDRTGRYWFVECLYNLGPKTYLATRYGDTSLDGGALAKLGGISVAVNNYHRLSLGVGYRITPMTHLKLELTRNTTSGGVSKPDLDQIAIGLATKF